MATILCVNPYCLCFPTSLAHNLPFGDCDVFHDVFAWSLIDGSTNNEKQLFYTMYNCKILFDIAISVRME